MSNLPMQGETARMTTRLWGKNQGFMIFGALLFSVASACASTVYFPAMPGTPGTFDRQLHQRQVLVFLCGGPRWRRRRDSHIVELLRSRQLSRGSRYF